MNRLAQEPFQDRGKRVGETNSRLSDSGSGSDQQSEGGSSITSEVQEALDQQVVRGARMMSNVARSAKRAAQELERDAPQIAGLVSGVADRVEEYSRTLEKQSVTDLYRTASDFTRHQPALVFGMAALAGFFALRTLKSSQTGSAGRTTMRSSRNEQFYGS